jgi:hypothetical protein
MLEMQLKGLEHQIVVEEKKQELQALQDAELSLSTMEAELTKAKEELETAEEHWRDEYEPWTQIIPDDDRGQQVSRLIDLIKTSKRALRQERKSTQEKIQSAVAEEIEKHKPLHDAGIAIRLRRIQYNLPPHERNDNIMYMGNKVSHYGCALEDALMLAAKPNPAFEKVRIALRLQTPLYLSLNTVFSSSMGVCSDYYNDILGSKGQLANGYRLFSGFANSMDSSRALYSSFALAQNLSKSSTGVVQWSISSKFSAFILKLYSIMPSSEHSKRLLWLLLCTVMSTLK